MTPSPKSLAEELRALAAREHLDVHLVDWRSVYSALRALAARAEREEKFLDAAKSLGARWDFHPMGITGKTGLELQALFIAAFRALSSEDSAR